MPNVSGKSDNGGLGLGMYLMVLLGGAAAYGAYIYMQGQQ
jgi:hypothetical protein